MALQLKCCWIKAFVIQNAECTEKDIDPICIQCNAILFDITDSVAITKVNYWLGFNLTKCVKLRSTNKVSILEKYHREN